MLVNDGLLVMVLLLMILDLEFRVCGVMFKLFGGLLLRYGLF